MYKLRYSVVLVTLVAAMIALSGRSMRAAEGQDATAENERQLIAVLESDAPPADKAITCKRLAIYGTKEAVPALAGLLPNRELASWARIALEAIPDPAADEALRAAVEKVEGRLRVGVINSIGVRRDAQAVGILVPQLQQADADVASAAAVALGHIGDPASAESLEQALAAVPDAVRAAVAEGLVYCAEKCLADENFAEATRIYDLVRAAEVPKPRMLEATRGAILARRSDGIPLLIEQLESADRALFGLGLFTAREMTGTDVTKALVAEMGKMTPERQGLVITALADRGDTAALPALLQAVKDGPPQVRMAALGALPQLGDDSCIETLLGISTEGDAGLAQALKTALQGLKGEEADVELTSRLAKAEGDARLVLIEVVGERRIAAAVPALLKSVRDSDAQIRSAVLTALGSTIGPDQLSVLISRVIKPLKPEDAEAAGQALLTACVRMPDRDACAEELVAAMPEASNSVRCTFAEILGAMGGPKALDALAVAAKDPSPELQDASTRLLGEWMTADAAPVLLDLSKTASEDRFKIRALRGYIRIARQLKVPTPQRIEMCRHALEACQRPDEKQLVFEVLGRVPAAKSLSLVVAELKDSAVKLDAGRTAIAIAEKLVASDAAAVAEAMKQVVDAGGDPEVVNRAKALAERAGRKTP